MYTDWCFDLLSWVCGMLGAAFENDFRLQRLCAFGGILSGRMLGHTMGHSPTLLDLPPDLQQNIATSGWHTEVQNCFFIWVVSVAGRSSIVSGSGLSSALFFVCECMHRHFNKWVWEFAGGRRSRSHPLAGFRPLCRVWHRCFWQRGEGDVNNFVLF